MGLFNKKEKVTFCKFSVVDGCIPGMSSQSIVKISLLPDQMEIRQIIGGKNIAYLSYAQITNAQKINEKEITEADKSSVGRAVVGGVLRGPLGAVVGGMSGIGKKKKTKYKDYFVVNYTSSVGEPSVISFEIVGATVGFSKFLSELKQNSDIVDPPVQEGPTFL